MERDPKIEKLIYQENKISYNLALLALLVNQYYLVKVLNNTDLTYHIGIEIFINLFIYLLLFLGMEKVRKHHPNWSLILIGIGIGFFARIFYMPRRILKVADMAYTAGDERSLQVAENLVKAVQQANFALIIAGILIVVSGLLGYKQAMSIKNYYKKLKSV